MGLFLVWCHRPICIVLCLCKHACKEVCDVNPGIDPYPLLARLCDRWWPDFVTFTACKKSRFGLQRGKEAQCVSNRSKDLYERKKYFGVRCTLTWCYCWFKDGCSLWIPMNSLFYLKLKAGGGIISNMETICWTLKKSVGKSCSNNLFSFKPKRCVLHFKLHFRCCQKGGATEQC